ncbi:MAG: hypothetical protein E7384_06340 [Ruminococcaceae bacterium]|nr:hypothetical protein [Oscillospiraceae bacterium]
MKTKRILSLLLVFCLVFTSVNVGFRASETPLEVEAATTPTHYNVFLQTDLTWGSYNTHNSGATIARNGCGLMSIVNAVYFLNGNRVDIKALADWAYSSGAYGTSGSNRYKLYPNLAAKFGAKYGFTTPVTWRAAKATNPELINHLANGGVAVAHVKRHFICLAGYDAATGRILVLDSAPNSEKRFTSKCGNWLTPSELTSDSDYMKVDGYCLMSSTVANCSNYTATASVTGSGSVFFGNDYTSGKFAAGDTVMFRAIPGSGYKVSSVSVNGTAIAVQAGGAASTYTFTMPYANANVSVKFSTGGATYGNSMLTSAASYTMDQSIVVRADSASVGSYAGMFTSSTTTYSKETSVFYYSVPEFWHYNVDGTVLGYTFEMQGAMRGGNVQAYNAGNFKVLIFDANGNVLSNVVNITLTGTSKHADTFKYIPTSFHRLNAQVVSGQGSVHFGNNVTSASVSAGTTVYFQTTPASGYKVSKITVGGTDVEVKNNGGDFVYDFTMPAADTVVSVTFVSTSGSTTPPVQSAYKLSASFDSGMGSVHFGGGATSADVQAGTTVYCQTTPKSGYIVSQITVGGTAVDVQNGGGDCVYQFVMPASDCVVSVKFTKVSSTTLYTVSTKVVAGKGVAHFGANITTASVVAGQNFNYQVTPEDGYRIARIEINGIEQIVENDGADYIYNYTMGAVDTVISVTFESVYLIEDVTDIIFDSDAAASWIEASGAYDTTVKLGTDDKGDSCMVLTSSASNDPHVNMDYANIGTLSASTYKYIVITAKTSASNIDSRLYLCPGTITGPTESCAVSVDWINDGLWHDYLIDLSSLSNWTGNLNSIRFDYFDGTTTAGSTLYFRSIKFYSSKPSSATISTNKTSYNVGDSITLNYSGLTSYLNTNQNQTPFIAIYADGTEPGKGSALLYTYVTTASGSATFPAGAFGGISYGTTLPAGKYTAWVAYDGKGDTQDINLNNVHYAAESSSYEFTIAENSTTEPTIHNVSTKIVSGQGVAHFGANITSADVYSGTTFNYQVTPAAGYKTTKISINGVEQAILNNGGDAIYSYTMKAETTVISVTFEIDASDAEIKDITDIIFDSTPAVSWVENATKKDTTVSLGVDNKGDTCMVLTSASSSDPFVYMNYSDIGTLSASTYKYAVITAKTTAYNIDSRLYLCPGTITGPTESCAVSVDWINDGLWHDYLIDLSSLSNWTGNLNSIRFDYFDGTTTAGSTLYFRSIKFYSSKPSNPTITTDKTSYNVGESITLNYSGLDSYLNTNQNQIPFIAIYADGTSPGNGSALLYALATNSSGSAAFPAGAVGGISYGKTLPAGKYQAWVAYDAKGTASTANLNNVHYAAQSASYDFTIVDDTYEISAETVGGKGVVHFGDGNVKGTLKVGTTVYFQTTPADGYKVSAITVGGVSVAVENNGADHVYNFVLGAADTEVLVTFSKIATCVDRTDSSKVYCNGGNTVSDTIADIKSKLGVTSVTIKKDGKECDSNAVIATGMVVTAGSTSYTMIVSGDVDCDGEVTVSDAAATLSAVRGYTTISAVQKAAVKECSKNTSSSMNILDVMAILNGIVYSEVITDDCMEYDLDKYTQPYWESDIIYNESVMPLENSDGSVPAVSLMYNIKEIVSVKSSDFTKIYFEGKDYVVENGMLKILPTGSIDTIDYSFMYPSSSSTSTQPDSAHGYMYFAEGSVFHEMQLAVTYVKSGTWTGAVPEQKSDLLPKTMAKLEAGESLNVVLLGDSISVGANSTEFVNAAPYSANWYKMVTDSLTKEYGSKISFTNLSVGGMDSAWGVTQAATAASCKPDLIIIGFGMNDGSASVSTSAYKSNIKSIIDTVKASNPDCEVILLSTMLSNPDWTAGHNQASYLPVLESFEGTGCAVADITTPHSYLLTRKRFVDMTGNNVNHPNDFIVRLYAQVVLELFK